ncbi:MAG: UTP--glucose-1-phosphate uridylyltransferase [Alteromonas naphthalenivorans]|jgi:UTP--glucose-1-phosphate uridylyltransferase
MDIEKVVIPAAGKGTRFLPFTKSVPKEMLPLLEKPAIQYIIEEGLQAAIKNYIIITSSGKQALGDYFDAKPDLDEFLKENNKEGLLRGLEKITRSTQFTYIRQAEALGLGHAVSLAEQCINKEYFGVMLPDDILVGKQSALGQLMRIARQEKGSVVAVQEVPIDCISSYGVIDIKQQITPHLFQISNLVEKPAQKDAPSNLAIIGRYVLSHKVFNSLDHVSTYSTEEIQLTDAIAHMIQNNEKVFAYKVQSMRYDVGTPIGWIKAIIGLALQHPLYAPHIKSFIADLGTADSYIYNQSKNIEHIV